MNKNKDMKVWGGEVLPANKLPIAEIICGMSEKEYHADKSRMSKHMLERFAANPWKYFTMMDNQDKVEETETPSMLFGRVAHAITLTPERFAYEYAVQPNTIKRRVGKAWDEFREANLDKTIVTQDTLDKASAIASAVRANHEADTLLGFCNMREVTVHWEHPSYRGVLLKSRLDAMSNEGRTIVDLKTCCDASADAFIKEADTFGYDMQAAMYIDAAAVAGKDPKEFVFICVEKTFPFAIGIYRFTRYSDFVQAGRVGYRGMLELFQYQRDCREGGFPVDNYPTKTDLTPAAWSKRYRRYLEGEYAIINANNKLA